MACNCLKRLDSGFRRNDGKRYFETFYEIVNIYSQFYMFWIWVFCHLYLFSALCLVFMEK